MSNQEYYPLEISLPNGEVIEVENDRSELRQDDEFDEYYAKLSFEAEPYDHAAEVDIDIDTSLRFHR